MNLKILTTLHFQTKISLSKRGTIFLLAKESDLFTENTAKKYSKLMAIALKETSVTIINVISYFPETRDCNSR